MDIIKCHGTLLQTSILEGRLLSERVGNKDGAVILLQCECDFEEKVISYPMRSREVKPKSRDLNLMSDIS